MKLGWKPLLSAVRLGPGRTPHTQPWLAPLFRDASLCKRFQSHRSTSKNIEPLRILFCGSDDFSCANLRALYDEQAKNSGLIGSIDVVVRPGKRVGRGYKKIQHPPLRDLATELNLPIHERDTFTGWTMPPHINLIIAVSFGLFVPPRLLRAAKYGGLNVHPSLLPEFRGAAPLHHTLLASREATGVTLQTLDDKTFDAGVILAQTSLDAAYQIPAGCTPPELQSALTPLATEMLVRSLREGRHVPPYRAVGWQAESGSASGRSDENIATKLLLDASAKAPKITPLMRQLVPPNTNATTYWTAHAAVHRQHIVGPLWFMARGRDGRVKRVIVEGRLEDVTGGPFRGRSGVYRRIEIHRLGGASSVSKVGREASDTQSSAVHAVIWIPDGDEDVYLMESCTSALKIAQLKVEGEKVKPAKLAVAQFTDEEVDEDQIRGISSPS
ncbi:putative methionyl-tRNA formyltransferase [Seiridium cardinale]